MTSGFRLRIDAFLPCSNQLADMLAASARLEDLRKSMEAALRPVPTREESEGANVIVASAALSAALSAAMEE